MKVIIPFLPSSPHNQLKDLGIVRLGIIAGIIGLIVWGAKSATKWTIKPVGYGVPKFQNWVLTLPILLQFSNPIPASVNIDRIVADIYLQKTTGFDFVGRVDQPLRIPSGTSVHELHAQIDIQKVFGDILNTAANAWNQKQLVVRTEVTAWYGGLRIPTQTITSPIQL